MNSQFRSPLYKKLKIGKDVGLDYIKRISLSGTHRQPKLKKLYSIECGEFFMDYTDETAYQYGNMGLRMSGNQAAIMQIVDLPNTFKIKYKNLIVDNSFNPQSLNSNQFEVHKTLAGSNDSSVSNKIGMFGTDVTTTYDTYYSIRNLNSDDILFVYYLDNRIVNIEVRIQC